MFRSLLFKFLCLKFALLLFVLPALAQPARDQAVTVNLIQYLNTASPADLDILPGVGEKLIVRIIENRPYITLEDISKIKGIKVKRLEKLYQWFLTR